MGTSASSVSSDKSKIIVEIALDGNYNKMSKAIPCTMDESIQSVLNKAQLQWKDTTYDTLFTERLEKLNPKKLLGEYTTKTNLKLLLTKGDITTRKKIRVRTRTEAELSDDEIDINDNDTIKDLKQRVVKKFKTKHGVDKIELMYDNIIYDNTIAVRDIAPFKKDVPFEVHEIDHIRADKDIEFVKQDSTTHCYSSYYKFDKCVIATFNIKWFGSGDKRDNKTLVNVLIKNNIDIVLIQEQVAPGTDGNWQSSKTKEVPSALKDFVSQLVPQKYCYLDSQWKTGQRFLESNSTQSEMYAVLYNPYKVTINTSNCTFIETNLISSIFSRVPYNFRFNFNQGENSLIFNLISVHLKPNADKKKERNEEFKAIYRFININVNLLKVKNPTLTFSPYIILGDTNIEDNKELTDHLNVMNDYISLNTACTPTNLIKTKPYDHVFIEKEFKKNYH